MSTTLTNGLKLPDKGSVDWYADMQNNYTILDGAVGTIADHTTAIAGKAASSHTHTKSDVTDLLNSNFIPSANNSYDLGSSSYQWNNLYAKGYYYNGTAWGLDQINVWTNRNILEAWGFTIREKTITDSTPPSSDVGRSLIEVWGGDSKYWGGFGYRWGANGVAELVISNSNWNGNTQGYWEYTIGVNKAFDSLYFNPPNGMSDLGTSDHKWKTLNGINPGALSLPTLNYTNTSKYMDISGGLSTTGSDNWYTPAVDGWIFMIIRDSPTFANILVFVTPRGATPAQFIAGAGGVLEPSSNTLWCGCPAPAGSRVRIRIKNGTIEQAVFVTCQGNV